MAKFSKNQDSEDFLDDEDITWGDDKGIAINKIIFAHMNRISEFIFKSKSDSDYKESSKGVQKPPIDKRETIISAIEFLDCILSPKYKVDPNKEENHVAKKIKDIRDKIDKQEEKLINISLEKEAEDRAMKTIKSKSQFKDALLWWKEYLEKQNYQFFDKDSAEYEYFMQMKERLMMEIFKEMNLFLGRVNYLETEAYTE